MARFLKHIGCSRCGSSDANAVYEDGSQFCFSCRKPTGSKVSPYVEMHRRNGMEESQMESFQEKAVRLPADASTNYSASAVAWAAKYEISVTQLLQEGVVYSPSREQLIFTWHDDSNKLLAYQARNLNAVSKAKRYYTCGDVNNLLPIYPCRSGSINEPQASLINNRRLVLVEDCLSAIKVANTNLSQNDEKALGADAMPLLGSGINLRKLSQLKRFYEVLDVFLDPDMWHKSLNIVKQAQMLGFQARAVQSDRDPKEHSTDELRKLLTA